MPATATPVEPGALTAEAGLAGRAASGDQAAFDELYRRHVQAAWRFAQAVTASREQAEQVTEEAFTRVLRVVRRGRTAAAERFRPYLLAAVHRTALDALRAHGRADESGEHPTGLRPAAPNVPAVMAGGDDQFDRNLLQQAFRSLPQRWRAALWLTDVEGMPAAAVAPILGVSAAVTVALVGRARTGLAHRFDQAAQGCELPDVPAALRDQTPSLPTGLAGASLARWKNAMATERHRVVPAAGWLTDRAPRPLAVCAAGLLALGLIGLGVIGQRGGLGGGSSGGPAALPLATHQFNGPPGASLDLAGSVTLLSGPGGLASAVLGNTGLAGSGGVIGAPFGSLGAAGTGASGSLTAAGPAGGGTTGGGAGPLPAGGLPGGGLPGGGLPGGGLPGGGLPGGGLPPVTVPLPPVTLPPVNLPPVTLPPVTSPPVTLPPATLPPVTLPPVTLPPVTTPPVHPPVTLPPVPTTVSHIP